MGKVAVYDQQTGEFLVWADDGTKEPLDPQDSFKNQFLREQAQANARAEADELDELFMNSATESEIQAALVKHDEAFTKEAIEVLGDTGVSVVESNTVAQSYYQYAPPEQSPSSSTAATQAEISQNNQSAESSDQIDNGFFSTGLEDNGAVQNTTPTSPATGGGFFGAIGGAIGDATDSVTGFFTQEPEPLGANDLLAEPRLSGQESIEQFGRDYDTMVAEEEDINLETEAIGSERGEPIQFGTSEGDDNCLDYADPDEEDVYWEKDANGECVPTLLDTGEDILSEADSFRNKREEGNPIQQTDWRFRVSLSPFADYLYNHPNAESGLLAPLRKTDGVIFPYTPSITVPNQANYQSYDLTHSNHRGYFYKGSYTGEIIVNATFTAQDTAEAEYLLAVMTFFKAASKMFYGQDKGRRGTPPPLLYMNGMGEYAFNEHPCVISSFNINYPDNVDYVRCHVGSQQNDSWTGRMQGPSGHQSWGGRISRLVSSGLSGNGFDLGGAFAEMFGIPEVDVSVGPSATGSSFKGKETYVPSEIQLQLVFLPVQTRDQVSNTFSLEKYASGELIKKGFW